MEFKNRLLLRQNYTNEKSKNAASNLWLILILRCYKLIFILI